MFCRPETRLFVGKFLGIFGASQVDVKGNENDNTQKGATAIETKLSLNDTKDDASQPNVKRAIEASTKKIVGLLLEKGIPGLSVCVSRKGKIVWNSAFGFCDVENQLECLPDARMRIASISKPLFVSAIIAPMIEQNKIDIKSSIHKYLTQNEFPKKDYLGKETDITIEQLLSHTSGIKHYEEGHKPEGFPLRPIGSEGSQRVHQCDDQYNRQGFYQRQTYRTVFDALQAFKDAPLASEPGKYRYTTYGYTLLSAVAERINQQNADDKSRREQIEDYWLKVIQRDWKMEETNLDQDEPIMPNRARYYLRTGKNGALINAPYTDNSVKWAGGGIISSAKDVVKFANILIDSYKGKENAKLKRETVELLWKEVKESYALGFCVKTLDQESGDEKRVVYHTGHALGASSVLIIYPETEIAVAILANLDYVNLSPLGIYIANQFMNSSGKYSTR